MADWPAKPEQTEPLILRWAQEHPKLVSLETRRTFGGRNAYAVTVTNPALDDRRKARCAFDQPHAHEPATTAGMMDFLSQLLDGCGLDGRPGGLDAERLRGRTVLTFIPDGNPDGRSRAPVDFWDGSRCDNEEFLKIAFGRTDSGERCRRLGRWSLRDEQPAQIGIVYEQINEHEFLEPNRDRGSTFFRLLTASVERYRPHRLLGLHQTEFERSAHNAMVLLPFLQDRLPAEVASANVRWAGAILDAWRRVGAAADPQPRPLAYGEDQIRYFRQCWSDLYASTPCLSTEVQNNNPRTPVDDQVLLCVTAIGATVEHALAERAGGGQDGAC